MSNIKGLTDLPSFDSSENKIIEQAGGKPTKSVEEAKRTSTYGHTGVPLTQKKSTLFDTIRNIFRSSSRKDIEASKKEFPHTVTKREEKWFVQRLKSFFSRTSLTQAKGNLEIPAKPPLYSEELKRGKLKQNEELKIYNEELDDSKNMLLPNEILSAKDELTEGWTTGEELKNRIKNMDDLHNEIMFLSDKILSAQDEDIFEDKVQLRAAYDTLKNELETSDRFKPEQDRVRVLENQFQLMGVRLGLHKAEDPIKETEKLLKRSSKEREMKRISRETGKEIKNTFNKPTAEEIENPFEEIDRLFDKILTVGDISDEATKIMYMDYDQIIKDKDELMLKLENYSKHLELERLNPESILAEIQAAKMKIEAAQNTIDLAIRYYTPPSES